MYLFVLHETSVLLSRLLSVSVCEFSPDIYYFVDSTSLSPNSEGGGLGCSPPSKDGFDPPRFTPSQDVKGSGGWTRYGEILQGSNSNGIWNGGKNA